MTSFAVRGVVRIVVGAGGPDHPGHPRRSR
jgi:hypothetical protein